MAQLSKKQLSGDGKMSGDSSYSILEIIGIVILLIILILVIYGVLLLGKFIRMKYFRPQNFI